MLCIKLKWDTKTPSYTTRIRNLASLSKLLHRPTHFILSYFSQCLRAPIVIDHKKYIYQIYGLYTQDHVQKVFDQLIRNTIRCKWCHRLNTFIKTTLYQLPIDVVCLECYQSSRLQLDDPFCVVVYQYWSEHFLLHLTDNLFTTPDHYIKVSYLPYVSKQMYRYTTLFDLTPHVQFCQRYSHLKFRDCSTIAYELIKFNLDRDTFLYPEIQEFIIEEFHRLNIRTETGIIAVTTLLTNQVFDQLKLYKSFFKRLCVSYIDQCSFLDGLCTILYHNNLVVHNVTLYVSFCFEHNILQPQHILNWFDIKAADSYLSINVYLMRNHFATLIANLRKQKQYLQLQYEQFMSQPN